MYTSLSRLSALRRRYQMAVSTSLCVVKLSFRAAITCLMVPSVKIICNTDLLKGALNVTSYSLYQFRFIVWSV